MRLKQFAENEKQATEGKWMEAGAGLRLKIARLNNSSYKVYVRKLSKPHTQSLRRGTISMEVMNSLSRKALAKTVLLDWEYLEDDNGKTIPYSVGKAEELLSSCPGFQDMVEEMAQEITIVQENEDEDTAGNSKPS